MHVRDNDRRSAVAVHRQARRADSHRAADEMPWPGANRTSDAPDRPDAATVLRWQQTVGNQAVQRLLQRDDEVFRAPSDWVVEPPKPVTETDSTYDTEDEKRRAEQKAADERGESPKPNEWWKNKPPQPKPTDPKSYEDLQNQIGQGKSSDSGGGGIDFGPLPPAEEQQPGDYPLTPAIEPDDAAYA